MMNKPQTPLEKLNSDKRKLLKVCTEQEHKLNDDFTYIQNNAGSLVLSGLSGLIFPNTKSKTQTTDTKTPAKTTGHTTSPLKVADYLTIGLGAVPLIWDFARPLVMSWGIKKANSWVIKKLFGRKK